MKRHNPPEIYRGLPCSTVAVGTACGVTTEDALSGLVSVSLRWDGYLSLDAMNRLVRANCPVKRRRDFKRGQRPTLAQYVHANQKKAVVCVKGHFLYTDGKDYYSFFWNGQDEVVCVWELQ